jgi:limonene-1,2-epoxide hydrolase
MFRGGLATLAVLAVTAAGCGGSGDDEPAKRGASHRTPAPVARRADPAKVQVIRGWVDSLRAGHVDAAARYFAVPSVVQNGSPLIKLRSVAEVRAFNAALPCGARLKRTFSTGRYVAATFVLTERPGGHCGGGTGQLAATAFIIRGGKIVEWRRVPLPSEQLPAPGPSPAPRHPDSVVS